MPRLRNKANGVIVNVDDATADRLGSGWEDANKAAAAQKSEKPDKTWKNDDLKSYATERGIDLGDATKKEDFLAAIELHEEALNNKSE
jgi:hypothetical protein